MFPEIGVVNGTYVRARKSDVHMEMKNIMKRRMPSTPSTLAGTLCVAMILAGTASAAPRTAADREEARITIEAGGYDAGRGGQAAVNIYVAAALAQCADRRLTMIEEMRLGILLISDIEPWTSLSEISVALQSALSMNNSDCESPQVQSAIQEFSAEVLPQLQSPIVR